MRWRAISFWFGLGLGALTLALAPTAGGARSVRLALPRATACAGWGRPAISADARPRALRVFALQFAEHPAAIVNGASYSRAIDCAMRTEVLPHLAHGRSNLVVFDEDIGLETLAVGPRGASARALLRRGNPLACRGRGSPCATLATLSAINDGYARALSYLEPRFPSLEGELGRSFVAATDEFVRVFMTTMATEARRYGVYVIASNTQAPFALTSNPAAVAALRDPATPRVRAVYAPTAGVAYDQTFVWGPRVVHRGRPSPLANLLVDNDKVPLTLFEQELGFAAGPAGGAAARANLRPIAIPGTGARLGIATSLPAFAYGRATRAHACDDVALTYMRCLDALRANVLIQADANDGLWAGQDGSGVWQPLSWMGSAFRAVTDPSVDFAYAVNPFMVGNLADTPFDGQSAILQRGLSGGAGCRYVGNGSLTPGSVPSTLRADTGAKTQFLALAPWAVPDAPPARLQPVAAALAAGRGRHHYVQTAVIADLTFPADRRRRGCVMAGR